MQGAGFLSKALPKAAFERSKKAILAFSINNEQLVISKVLAFLVKPTSRPLSNKVRNFNLRTNPIWADEFRK